MNRGITLVETIFAIGIGVIALTALIHLFVIFNTIYDYQHAFAATAGSSGRSMDAFQAAILPASQVLASHNFSGTVYTSTTTSLVLELPSINSSGNLIIGAKDYVAFYTSGANLYRLVLPDAQSVRAPGQTTLSTSLSSLVFMYDDSNFAGVTRVAADIQTQLLFRGQVIQSHLQEQWYLRNVP